MTLVQRRPPSPMTVCEYEELVSRINDMCIGIKLHYCEMLFGENEKAWNKAKGNRVKPSLENIMDIYTETEAALSEIMKKRKTDGWLIDAYKRVHSCREKISSLTAAAWVDAVKDLENAIGELNKERYSLIKYKE